MAPCFSHNAADCVITTAPAFGFLPHMALMFVMWTVLLFVWVFVF